MHFYEPIKREVKKIKKVEVTDNNRGVKCKNQKNWLYREICQSRILIHYSYSMANDKRMKCDDLVCTLHI